MPGYVLITWLALAVPQAPPRMASVSPEPSASVEVASGIPLLRNRVTAVSPILENAIVRRAAVVPSAPVRSEDQELVEYTDAYFVRQQIHKWSSWAMLPLFALQYASGRELAQKGGLAPQWARNAHGPAAAGVATLFAVNTVTGGMNLWQSRKDPYGRGWRMAHGLLMLAADAGFVATGMLAEEAEDGGSADLHQNVAIGSMAVAALSWLMMLPPFRRD